MINSPSKSMQNLPKPSKGRGGLMALTLVTLMAVVATAAALYWLSRDEQDRQAFGKTVQKNVETVVKDTPLENVVRDYLPENTSNSSAASARDAARKPSVQSVMRPMSAPPDTLQGAKTSTQMSSQASLLAPTQSEQSPLGSTAANDQDASSPAAGAGSHTAESTSAAGGTLPSTDPASMQGQASGATSTAAVITPVAPKVTQDSKVPLSFVDDAAQWLVRRYSPRKNAQLSLSSLNLRYGQKMHTLMPEGGSDVLGARSDLLRYAFNSTMMTALYDLYAPHFVQSMQKAATEPLKNGEQRDVKKVLGAYAKDFNIVGSVLEGIGALPDFAAHMQDIEATVQASLDIHAKLTEVVFEYDTALEQKNQTAMDTIQLRIDSLNAQYQRTIHERTLARESLIGAVRKAAPAARSMDADSILYISQWLERRLEQGQDAAKLAQSAQTAGKLLQDLSSRLQKAGLESHEQPQT